MPCLPLMLSLRLFWSTSSSACSSSLPAVCTVTEDQNQTVSVVPSPRFVLFVFSSLWFVPVFCPSRQASPHAASPHARRSREFMPPFAALPSRGSREFTPPFAALHPAVRGRDLRRRSRLSHPAVRGTSCRRSRLSDPAVRGSWRRSRLCHPAVRGSSRRRSRINQPSVQEMTPPSTANPSRRPASDSMPAGLPLTQCPAGLPLIPARQECRWLKLAGLPLTQARRIAADSCHWSSAGKANSPLSASRRRPRPTSVSRASCRGESQPAVRGSRPAAGCGSLQPAGPAVVWSSPPAAAVICQASRLWSRQPAAAVLTSQPAVAEFDQTVT